MASGRSILAIDQGTTSTRAILFDQAGQALAAPARAAADLPGRRLGRHDPEEIWRATLAVCREAIAGAGQRPGTSRRSASPTSARHPVVGAGDRSAALQRHRLADRRGAPLCRRLVEQASGRWCSARPAS